ncbi:hypothetical protein AXG93_3943s1040 [Marchantia polymorpha subsp. ruderalis]|uniref:Uncharacterized protein n=1 Tax=Marchantia polymorpha subsp. ruderalis TaxID=1480154 RepID=A0A176WE04_MARPO|nr:hypothetical protein AXG93_3943s1040 [Marchantia polymorpha subsp. ruderalis]
MLQEVVGYFSHFEPQTQEYLYKVYALVGAQIRENVIAEFDSICKEHQVYEVLDHVSDRALISADGAGDHIHPEKVVKEVAVRRKLQEMEEVKRRLGLAQKENDSLEAQLKVLHLEIDNSQDQGSDNALYKKIQKANIELFKLLD